MVSTHAPLAGSDCLSGLLSGARIVSTHAPLAGSDRRCRRRCPPRRVSTHAPLAGSDSAFAVPNWHTRQFQPTLPLRGATFVQVGYRCRCFCFNPRSPCGERPEPKRTTLTKEGFNPRSPCGERYHGPQSDPGRLVSTHAPLAGSDTAHQSKSAEYSVSTHAPLAVSDARESRSKALDSTVSTHAPLAGSDCSTERCRAKPGRVSTHAPLAGSDHAHR